MKIALIGFGNMGQEINSIVKILKEFEIVSISYKNRNDQLDTVGLKKADVAIDFTSPDIVIKNIKTVLSLRVPLVVGTTGWYDHLENVKKIVIKSGLGVIYGQNFSIGANLFFKLIAQACKQISKFDYDVYGFEIHHAKKKDSPSGTAKKLREIIQHNFFGKKVMQTNLQLASVRGGVNPGFHEIIFDSFADEIKLSHQAHNRSGFAEGALLAARFIKNKKGFYSFDEVFSYKGGDKK